MGLDMYAYTATKPNARREWYDNAQWDDASASFKNTLPGVEEPTEIAYWRKHPSLHGFMADLWRRQGNDGEFNGDELELTLDDLLELEIAVQAGQLPPTSGFFFGNPADSIYLDEDLEFIATARQAIKNGLRVFYNSSW